MFMKKRSAVAAMIVLFICVAVYLNFSYTQGIGMDDAEEAGKEEIIGESELVEKEESSLSDDYFTNARLERQKARDGAISTLKETTVNESVSQEERDRATSGIESLANGAVSESRIETLVKAKGFEDCVTLINSDGVNVIVKVNEEGLSAADASKIRDIVVAEAKVKPNQIKIVEIK